MALFDKPLFVFEMANNHQGSVEHGKKIICEIKKVSEPYSDIFDFAFKFQYRDLESFIHPDYKDRMDIKNIKRFQETRLTQEQFLELKKTVEENGMFTMCTAFDEVSAARIKEQAYNIIKIASCSFTDWPLLEAVSETGLPVIASGAGSTLNDVDSVTAFFQNRKIQFSLMHCIAQYPTADEYQEMNQITFYKQRYPNLRIGFSTHEYPDNLEPIKIAVAKGAMIFEKHVGVPTDEITLNGYSANPDQVERWLQAARDAFTICGVSGKRYESTEKEQADLAALKRGVFAKHELKTCTVLTADDYFLAFPCQPGQVVASDLSKYNKIVLSEDVSQNGAIMKAGVTIKNTSVDTLGIVKDINALLKAASVVVPAGSCCEISHHYGIEKFRETGVAMIDCVNREYCKKILIMLPGQNHPCHYHAKKEETFVVLHGDLKLDLGGEIVLLHKGDVMTVERNKKHSFSSENGCIFEEISTTHYVNDSFYDLADTFVTPRKTKVHLTKEMLDEINGVK